MGTVPAKVGDVLAEVLTGFASVDLAQLDQALLHDRVESKVILAAADAAAALAELSGDYYALEHLGDQLQGYTTAYFDSPTLRNYHEHHNQKSRRLKVRYRTYRNSALTFFEVKRNINGRTVKDRQVSRPHAGHLWPDDAEFLHERTGWDPYQMVPSLTVDYDRILLVKADFTERVTVDVNMRFSSSSGSTAVPALAVCEFKQPKLDRRSPAILAMRRRPQKFSKYCMGLASCDPTLKRNRFKKVFLSLESLDASPVRGAA